MQLGRTCSAGREVQEVQKPMAEISAEDLMTLPTPSGREWLARSWDSWVVTAAVMFVFYETELVFIKDNLK